MWRVFAAGAAWGCREAIRTVERRANLLVGNCVKLNRLVLALTPVRAMLLASSMVAALASFSTVAGTPGTSFNVNVTVQPVVHVDQTTHSNLVISELDVERGYVDVNEPVTMRVASNSANGFAVNVLPVNDVFANVVVHGIGSDVALGADGGMIVQRWQHSQTVSMNLKFQFALRPDTQPGVYSWPLQLSVKPL